ncbi:hypothetical protein C1H57_09805 [Clostridium sp. 2-1]|uniref:hypothetical protein n=1 Tax=Clostridium TaxID=1485 RepID=UPI0004177328|nr:MULTISPECIES: hypothetical protein [Clostridium]MBN7575560.1 hypothetical protein [Clostridium beijerinckii]MBN7580871.1 hypothetical protein [Clostridium beijerinckii]MBN7585324.1 hypothetical protein [Clostridium beijerinckii]MBO0521104.1 hypothetical protein [Clostridium beijerinckii]POO91539.1 hypothetical protein C1H57_09805 [Clostridium sp. 2-1]
MISVIETAIITIIISFISGLLLEYYKNLAPKILCNIGEGVPLELNNKKLCAYVLTVRNISNKTIHKLTLNIQGLQNDLKIGDAQITKGLKFDSSIEDNILDVYIPFLSKDDEFSATLYVESKYGEYKKPVVTIRSPENFKEIQSIEQGGIISSLLNMPKNIKNLLCNITKDDALTSNRGRRSTVNKGQTAKKISGKENSKRFGRDKNSYNNRKALIAIISIILIISIGALGALYFQEMSTNAKTSDEKTEVQKESTSESQSEGEQTKNANEKTPTSGKNKNSPVKVSGNEANKDSGAKTPQNGDTGTPDTKTQAGGASGNSDMKTSTDANSQSNTDTKVSTSGGTNGSTNLKPPSGTSSENTDAKASTSGANGNTDQKTSTDGTTKNVDTKSSAGGTTANSGN